jgi:hypothetical protein
VSNQLEPKPLRVSQKIGIPARFKAQAEQMQSSISALNFAAEYVVTNIQAPDVAPKWKRTNKPS